MAKIKVIFGLGNPGSKYETTYHNVGSLFAEALEKEGRLVSDRGIASGSKIVPMAKSKIMSGFMNESGASIKRQMRKDGVKPEEILVVHDDSDIPLGEYRYSFDSGSAGHHGVQSIIESLGTKKFKRLRIGIRRHSGKALDFVLKRISKRDMDTLKTVFKSVAADLERGKN